MQACSQCHRDSPLGRFRVPFHYRPVRHTHTHTHKKKLRVFNDAFLPLYISCVFFFLFRSDIDSAANVETNFRYLKVDGLLNV